MVEESWAFISSKPEDWFEDLMTLGQIIYYDYDHCREFLEERVRTLRETTTGIDTLAIYRELFYSFSYEALEQGALTLGQFDSGLVYAFIPGTLTQRDYPQGHEVLRNKACELLSCQEPPLVLELLAAQALEPKPGERGRIENWMRDEYLNDVLLPGKAIIQLYFDGGGFYNQVLKPQLEAQGFTLVDDYLKAAQSGILRVKHASAPGKVYKLPWMLWVREMMGGGFSIVYLMACFSTYLQKLTSTVGASS